LIEDRLIQSELEKSINLRHPCIAAPMGFISRTGSRELKLLGLSSELGSLSEVISANPSWWTPTAKAKAVAGLVLGLRFAHSLGLIHGCLNANNISFDCDHHIQIINFCSDSAGKKICGFSNEEWNVEADARGFASLLFEIVVGGSGKSKVPIPSDVPQFVSEMIKAGLFSKSKTLISFRDIFETLKQHNFGIIVGANSADVCEFVSWVEYVEQFCE
jgi:serine/threonine protein kinase